MHLAFPQKNFKPKAGGISIFAKLQRNKKFISIIIFLFTLYYLLFRESSSAFFNLDSRKLPEAHGLYNDETLTTRTLIFPPVEHAPLLKQLGVSLLFPVAHNGIDKKAIYDQAPALEETAKDTLEDQTRNVREAFKNTGKLVFDHKNRKSPEVVIVTDIDFEKYELNHLTKIVQNRVDYAQARHYGIYVRWTQEFFPSVSEDKNDNSWVRLLILRAAMHAFPESKYFWYLNQDGVIVNYDADIIQTLLTPEKLNPLLLKDRPVVPPSGAIHTYKNTKPENVKFLITQDERGLNTNSFIMVNDLYGRALLEFWSDKLYRNYNNFPLKEASALMHILQWHPVILSRTGLIPARTIASSHSVVENTDENNDIFYKKGDLAVILKDCQIRKSCETEFDTYWSKLHK
ncbi:alpha-1,6-mannosyltransferase [Saccharomycopsis crataegensis]|uniref:Alpha-1,6-mannosyltransferase n=1 Tax=Saccharomycopsis crataegensis TaxID=43959 RepID=A0AAV5QR27_9ASCO|nr:alpha-1,6-mannosyltransferase [Saccharomycopsis crataegensis]